MIRGNDNEMATGETAVNELDEIREGEEANYQTSKKVLGETVSLADDLKDLYEVLVDIATKFPLAAQDQYVTALHFLVGSQYQLTIGSLAALRGHLTDALRDCRLAIELCASRSSKICPHEGPRGAGPRFEPAKGGRRPSQVLCSKNRCSGLPGWL